MKHMIFHYPYPILDQGQSGSQVRPFQMLNAFREIGYQVHPVTGYGAERKQSIERVQKLLVDGTKFDFVYSESTTMPTLLSEPNHLPTYLSLDFSFFSLLKKYEVPVGLYYRDVHWRFPQYKKATSWYKRSIATPFYLYDWFQYKRLVDHLFIPSLEMAAALPGIWPPHSLTALPPGHANVEPDGEHEKKSSSSSLNLFYVGGITPPLYDLSDMLRVIQGEQRLQLTLCCRESEWYQLRSYYINLVGPNVHVVHVKGNELTKFYRRADVFFLGWAPNEYLNFAVPVKILESLGYGVPVLTVDGTEAARFVRREQMGWVAGDYKELCLILKRLLNHPEEIERKRSQMQPVRLRHTWVERANQVSTILCKRS